MDRAWKPPAVVAVVAILCRLAGAGAAFAAPLDSSCWLVLRDGQALAARCPYEIHGRRVVFRGADGVLAAVPVNWVDLAASELARRGPSPREARVVTLRPVEISSLAQQVGRAGEARKRAGFKGGFVDLSRVVAPAPAVGKQPAEIGPAEPALLVVGEPRPAPRTALEPPDRLLRLRVKRAGKPR
jgi:hypothetical protein